MKFNIVTFGCKVNQYESNMMKEKLLHHNFSYVENMSDADIVIVNTCTVTNAADSKCLKMIRHIKREFPNAFLAVVGCSTQNNQDNYDNLGINIILGNKDKSLIDKLIIEYLETSNRYKKLYNNRDLEFEDMFIENYNNIRAFIKIEDGCDNFCSYCIIPYVRGSVRCKDFNVVLEEVKTLVNNGHKEIVLTGIHTGRYESDNKDLSDLLNALEGISGLERIRISSIEITELNDKFMNTLKNNKKVCNHLHIPLQSGSEEILKKMNRKYNKEYFLNKINTIRSIRPDISITTDVIVGHPFESIECFNESMDFIKEINFSKVHVFPYSKRKGTASALMDNQVNETEKKKRVKEMLNLSAKLEKEYYNRFKGLLVDVLIEQVKDGKSIGHTSNYLLVEIDKKLEIGKIYSEML